MRSLKGSGTVSHVLRVSGALIVLLVGNALSFGTRTPDPGRTFGVVLQVSKWI